MLSLYLCLYRTSMCIVNTSCHGSCKGLSLNKEKVPSGKVWICFPLVGETNIRLIVLLDGHTMLSLQKQSSSLLWLTVVFLIRGMEEGAGSYIFLLRLSNA